MIHHHIAIQFREQPKSMLYQLLLSMVVAEAVINHQCQPPVATTISKDTLLTITNFGSTRNSSLAIPYYH